MENIKFQDLNLSNDSFKAIKEMGFEITTPIQSQAIPVVLEGRDVVGLASTGTGKTAAFGLPAIEKIDSKSKNIQTLILCPTRELAMQVAVEIKKFLKFNKDVSVLAIYGGQDIRKQIFGLRKRPQIIVGTPGRVIDHIERRTIDFKNVNMVILDEADEMLNMGFRTDIERILKTVNQVRQTLLFSATMSRDIMQITKKYQKDPVVIKVKAEEKNIEAIDQTYFEIESPYKIDMLMDLINKNNPKKVIVFCNTRRKVDKVTTVLLRTGFNAAGIHSDIRQNKRDTIMKMFRSGRIEILVATDVAARGIDVNDVELVFNFEIPREAESYVHRIGRTGRAGKTGKAFSFVSREEGRLFSNVLRFVKTGIKKYRQDSSEASSDSSKVKSIKPVTDTFPENNMEKKAVRVLKKINPVINSKEHSFYLDIAQSFTSNSKEISKDDLSAILLKMLVDSDSQKTFSRRFR
jgi:ATP-dependent RNA helicase DeaD